MLASAQRRCAPPTNVTSRTATKRRTAAPRPDLAFRPNGPAVQLDEFLNQREANSGAFEGSTLLAFDAMKALEQARQLGLWNSNAGVADSQLRAPPIGCDPHIDRNFSLEGELEGVRDKIEDDLLPHVAIDIDRLRQRSRQSIRSVESGLDRSPIRSWRPARPSGARDRWARSSPRRRPASMREKSSSELTSFSRRKLLRCAVSSRLALRRRQRASD